MEFSGNVYERSVTIGNSTGRAFTGVHGDGVLDSDGNADVTNWPGTDADGSGFRGGSWSNDADRAEVSNRALAINTSTARSNNRGFRAVRTGI